MMIYQHLTKTSQSSEWDKLRKSSEHYDMYHIEWEKARDVVAGSAVVKSKGSMYLPPIGNTQKKELRTTNYYIGKDRQYDEYLQTAPFYNQTGRSVDVYMGSLFRTAPTIEGMSPALQDISMDIDLAGNTVVDYIKELAECSIITGYVGTYVDHMRSDKEMTVNEAKSNNLRPYTVTVKDQDILSVKRKNIGGAMRICFVKLMLREEVVTDDYNYHTEERVVIMTLEQVGDKLLYRNRMWREIKEGDKIKDGQAVGDIELLHDVYPKIRNKFITEIPFWTVGNGTMSIVKDLVDVNLDHYLASANHTRLLRIMGWPIINITEGEGGIKPDERTKLRTRMNKGIWGSTQITPYGSTMALLEFTGKDADAHLKQIDKLEHRAAILGAYVLMDKPTVEGSDTLRVRSSGQMSSLNNIGHAVSETVSQVLQHMETYYGNGKDIMVEINRDYLPEDLDANMLKVLMAGVQGGIVPVDVLFKALSDSDRLPILVKETQDYLDMLSLSNAELEITPGEDGGTDPFANDPE